MVVPAYLRGLVLSGRHDDQRVIIIVHGRSLRRPETLSPLHYRDGARSVCTNQTGIACTKGRML